MSEIKKPQTPKLDYDNWSSIASTQTKGRERVRFYGVDSEGKKTRLNQAEALAMYGHEAGLQRVNALANINGQDQPVVVTGVLTEEGVEPVYSIEGSNTGVPASQILWDDEVDFRIGPHQPEDYEKKLTKLRDTLESGPMRIKEDLPQNLPLEEKLTRMQTRVIYLGQEFDRVSGELQAVKSELDDKNVEITHLQSLLGYQTEQSQQITDEIIPLHGPVELPKSSVNRVRNKVSIQNNPPNQERNIPEDGDSVETVENAVDTEIVLENSDRRQKLSERIGNLLSGRKLLAVYTNARQMAGDTENIEKVYKGETEYNRRRGIAFLGGVAVGAAAIGATWLALRGNNSGIDALQLDFDQLKMDVNNLPSEIADNFDNELSDLQDKLHAIDERLDTLTVQTEEHSGGNIQVINTEQSQSNFAVSLPDGWSVDNVGGHQVMSDASGAKILQIGQEVRVNGRTELLESFMDRQGNISKHGRMALREMGYNLSQGQFEFKRPNGTAGLHYMTIIRKG